MIRLADTPTLETERLILRAPRAEDWPAYCVLLTSTRGKGLGGPHSEARAFRDFALEIGHWVHFGAGPWAICLRGSEESLGLVGPFHPIGWPEREIGWMLWEGQEGQGYAYEAAIAAREHAYQALGWRTAVSYVQPDNSRSRALAERLGAAIDPHAAELDPGTLTYRHPAPAAHDLRHAAR